MDGNGEAPIFRLMIWNHPSIETSILNWLFSVPGVNMIYKLDGGFTYLSMFHILLFTFTPNNSGKWSNLMVAYV